jgi:hypothetical protein
MQQDEKEPSPQNLVKVIALVSESLGIVTAEVLREQVISLNVNE